MAMDCCLICFRLVSLAENNLLSEEKDDFEEQFKDFQRFFKMLNRYLKVDEKNILNESIFSNFGKSPACEECLKVMRSFCEVFHKIKTLELILNQKMRMLMNIMFCAGKIPARVACFKETFSSKLDTSSADQKINEILQYKKLLITKCSEKLSGTYPKLILARISNPMDDKGQKAVISEKSSLPIPSISPATASATVVEEEVEAPSVECSSQVNIADFSAPSSPVLDYASLDLCKLEAVDSKIQIRHFNNQEEEINDDFSIEVEDVKPHHVSSEAIAIAPSTRRSLRTIHKCSKCGRTFSSLDKLSVHQSSETCNEDKQSKIQSDSEEDDETDNLLFKNESGIDSSSTEEDAKPSVENQRESAKFKRFTKGRKRHTKNFCRLFPGNVCPVCQKVIPIISKSTATIKDEVISQHILHEHPEAFKTPGSPQPFSCPVFYCPFSFDNVRSLTKHCSGKHKAEFKLRRKYENQDHLERDLENPLHCPFPICDAACLSRALLTIHLKSAHESEWNPKSLTILSRKLFADRMDSMKKTVTDSNSQLNEDLEGEKEELKLKRLRTKCPECSEFFGSFYEMITHRKNVHLDSTVEESSLEDKLTIEIVNLREKEKEVHLKIEIGSSKIFTCSEGNPPCEQLFLFQEDLDAHRKLHGEFKCRSCEFIGENAVKLAEHEIKKHTENGDCIKDTDYSAHLHCPRCEEKFNRKYNYLEHFVTQHLKIERLLEQCCPICRDPYGFQSWTNELEARNEYEHLSRLHNLLSAKDPDIFRCKEQGCFAYFLNLNQLRNHTRIVHSFEKNPKEFRKSFRIKCKDCGKVLKRKSLLRKHRLRFHVKDSDKISCTVEGCQRKFELEKELTYHIKLCHTKQDRFQSEMCSKCGKSFKGTTAFRLHMAAHARKEKAEADGLIAQSWVCESCGKVFTSKCSLVQHILLRHKGPENWKCQCKICNKKCFDITKLKEHMRTHTNEKPFICQVCGVAYGHRHNLRIHVNNKHGDVMQDIAKKRDTSNLFRRKNNSNGESTQKKVKRRKVPQKEEESHSD